jgi:hypothetical protein
LLFIAPCACFFEAFDSKGFTNLANARPTPTTKLSSVLRVIHPPPKMATHSTINFLMANIKKEEEPMDEDSRLHYHRRFIEAMERRRLADEEVAYLERVVAEDNAKRVRWWQLHGPFSETPLFFPTPYEDEIYRWGSLHQPMLPGEVAIPHRDYAYNLVRPGTLVKLTTGKLAGCTGHVVGMWNTEPPEDVNETMWWIKLHDKKKVVRRMQKSLLLTDTYGGF